MQPEDADLALLWDMRMAAREVQSFVTGIQFHQLSADILIRRAVERSIHIIGEAARGISDKYQAEHPEIPWRRIIAQRNVIAHEYGEVLLERLWLVATTSVPELLRTLESVLPPDPELGKGGPAHG